jgi:hypothetical protein
MGILSTILAPFVALGVALGSFFVPQPVTNLGASEAVPVVVAFFETTLASAISSTATSFTLTSATDKDGTTLASSTYAFVIDEGSANEEIVIADCTATVCTNAMRGVSVRTGNTEVTALKKAHRRGASIKITDAPILMLVARALRGEDVTDFTPTGGGSLATKQYVDSVALGGGAVPSTYTDDGILELATGLQAASSTATDESGSPLALHTAISTSSAPATGSYVVVTGTDGNIADGFIASTSVTQYAVWYASTTIYAATTTAHSATSTYTKPAGLKWIDIELVGGGAGSNGYDTDNTPGTGASGAAGGYVRHRILASALSATTTVVAGSAGTAGTSGASPTVGGSGGDSKFGSLFAGGGIKGSNETGVSSGGSASGGTLNIAGESGQIHNSSEVGTARGGSTLLGNGGSLISTGGAYVSKPPSGYGGGGAPSVETDSQGATIGGYGAVIITEYF